MNTNVDTSGFDGIHEALTRATSGIDEMTQEQEEFNHTVSQGANQANELTKMIKQAVGAYVSFQTVKNVIGISDELVQVTARLDQMNDGEYDDGSNRIEDHSFGSLLEIVCHFQFHDGYNDTVK